jgi:shikimate kinase
LASCFPIDSGGDLSDLVVNGLPYHNLILTGSLGVRLLQTGKLIAASVSAPFFNLETVVQEREGRYPDELRKLYGEAYGRRVEAEISRELTLRRGTIITVTPSTLLDEETRERLLSSGTTLLLTCGLNETLRRLYIAQGTRFHDPKVRAVALATIKRDQELLKLDLMKLDTTIISVEDTATRAIKFWKEHELAG